jgi:hypothetical protein
MPAVSHRTRGYCSKYQRSCDTERHSMATAGVRAPGVTTLVMTLRSVVDATVALRPRLDRLGYLLQVRIERRDNPLYVFESGLGVGAC